MGKIYKNGIEYGGGGGDSAGHIILDNDGNSLPQEDNLQFKGLNVTDNSTDGITEVESAGLNQDSMDDVLNASISGNQVASNGLVYSTNEQVVGKWVDGKPLYQKTIQGVLGTTSPYQVDIPTGITNIGNVFSIDSILIYPTKASVPFPGMNFSDSTRAVYYDGNQNSIRAQSNVSSDAGNTLYVTIKYTKTS